MKKIMLICAPFSSRSGYGAHSRDICRSLIDLDSFDVRIWPVRWGSTPQNALSEQNPQDVPIIKRLLPLHDLHFLSHLKHSILP